MVRKFEDVFKTDEPARDKYLSRLFGIFSEDVVKHWCRCPLAEYEDIGRPTLRLPGESRGSTLDFTLRRRSTNEVFVAELKCELEYERYRYLRLADASQLQHHKQPAFQIFLQLAREPTVYDVRVLARPTTIHGAILVWGATTDEGCMRAINEYGFADVLSIERMLADLREWVPEHWTQRVMQVRRWSDALFDSLV